MRTLFRKTFLQLATVCAVAGLAIPGGCNSNFIPVPPPGDPTFEPVTVNDGVGAPRQVWQVQGPPSEAMKGGRVFIFNVSLGLGVIVKATDTGTYSSSLFEGALGDKVELSYETPASEQSPVICRRLQAGVAQTPCD